MVHHSCPPGLLETHAIGVLGARSLGLFLLSYSVTSDFNCPRLSLAMSHRFQQINQYCGTDPDPDSTDEVRGSSYYNIACQSTNNSNGRMSVQPHSTLSIYEFSLLIHCRETMPDSRIQHIHEDNILILSSIIPQARCTSSSFQGSLSSSPTISQRLHTTEPETYAYSGLSQAPSSYLHQTVYNPVSQQQVPITQPLQTSQNNVVQRNTVTSRTNTSRSAQETLNSTSRETGWSEWIWDATNQR